MTPHDRDAVLEAVTDAVLECPFLERLSMRERVQAANLIRRVVARRLAAQFPTPTGIQHD